MVASGPWGEKIPHAAGPPMTLLLFFVALAVGVSFLCSLAEATLLSVTPPFVEGKAAGGHRAGLRLVKLKQDVDRPLAAILILNTLANVLGATGAGAQASFLFHEGGATLFAIGFAVGILLFGELIPKTLGARYWRRLAAPVSLLLLGMIFLAWPLVRLARMVTGLVGSGKTGHGGVSREEIAAMADLGSRSGELEAQESHILRNLLRFRSGKVKDIMTPRTVVYLLAETMTVEEFARDAGTTPFTRIPVYGRNRDDVTGFVLKGDVLLAHVKGQRDRPVGALRREIKAIPATATLMQLFNALMEQKQHMMMVVDEFGGMEGVVTLEDVVETLLGLEIVDEVDRAPDLQKLARRLWDRRAREMGIDTGGGED